MILSGHQIRERLGDEIVIDPFDEKHLNPNSYNLSLHDEVMVYDNEFLNDLADRLGDRPRLTVVDVFKTAVRTRPRLLWHLGQLAAMGWF